MKKQYLSATCILLDLSDADILTLSKESDDAVRKPSSINFEDLF